MAACLRLPPGLHDDSMGFTQDPPRAALPEKADSEQITVDWHG